MKTSGMNYRTLIIYGIFACFYWAAATAANSQSGHARPYPPTTRPPQSIRPAPAPPVYKNPDKTEPIPPVELLASNRSNKGALGGVMVFLGGVLFLLRKPEQNLPK